MLQPNDIPSQSRQTQSREFHSFEYAFVSFLPHHPPKSEQDSHILPFSEEEILLEGGVASREEGILHYAK
jgi:hypothetical protein